MFNLTNSKLKTLVFFLHVFRSLTEYWLLLKIIKKSLDFLNQAVELLHLQRHANRYEPVMCSDISRALA